MRFLFAAVLAFWFVLATVPGSKAEWRGGDSFSQAVPESGATSLNGTVYLLSGSSGTGFKRFFEAYNIVEDGWRPLTPIPVDRTQFSVAAGSGQIVVTGGRVAGTSEATKSSWMFSTAKSYWTQITSMPGRRYEHMTAIIGNLSWRGRAGSTPSRGAAAASGSWRGRRRRAATASPGRAAAWS